MQQRKTEREWEPEKLESLEKNAQRSKDPNGDN